MPEDNAGVRYPPPLIYLAGLLLGIFGGARLPGALTHQQWMTWAGAALFAAGIASAASAIVRFHAAGTEVIPHRPATAFVRDGPYRFTRNPMYVGLALVYIAIAFWTASLWALVLLAPVLLVIRYDVIAREERYLTRRFGDEYRAFKRRVRRWI